MSKPLSIVILAAGKGTRMKSNQPKVMHPLAGKPMINWLIETCETLSPEKIIVVVGPDMPELEQAVSPHTSIVQETRDGTGGALRAALPALTGFDGDVLVLLGDTPLIKKETLKSLIAAKTDNPASILGCTLDNPTGYGRLILGDDGQSLLDIIEEKDANDTQKQVKLINTGAFCLDGSKIAGWLSQLDSNNAQGEFYITQIPSIMQTQGEVCTVAILGNPDEIRGCNTRVDLATLEKSVQQILREKAMLNGVSIADPDSVYFWHDTVVSAGVTIEPNVVFGPEVSIDENVQIKAFCHFEGVHIQSGAVIGPFARLRPGTEIGEDVRIGNFVEVKKSTIGTGSKINHLAYVGDCTMGKDVNFSAGAITVNYDGYNKHQTIIGDGVMVGSNVNLVAPVTLGEGAFAAAGSTIAKDVPADALAIERVDPDIRKGWAAKYRKLKAALKAKAS